MKTKLHCFLIALALLASFAQTARAAVGFIDTPAIVSNTYSGKITLQVTGLATTGDTVVVQKYLDANGNGVIDAGDVLWQQFSMTDGAASVFHDGATAVTNFNVPGDTDSTVKQITAPLNFQNGDFPQNIVGKYLYRLSADSISITNTFTVTNFPYAGSFTGTVFSNNTATAVSNAVIILFQGQNLNGVAGAVADNSGNYTIKAPPGTYLLASLRSNYMANLSTAPTLALGGSTVTTNLTLTNATQSISGKVVDANTPTIGLPGLLVPATSTNNFLAVGFADTNGSFTIGTRPGVWSLEGNDSGLIIHGYLGSQNSSQTNTTGGSVSGITNALPKATAVFYGSVKDGLGNALAGIDIFSQQQDNNNQYEAEAFTDTNGNYVASALVGEWFVQLSNDSNPTNYVYSQGLDAVLTNGQAQLYNFTALLATNHITGHVQDSNGNPIMGVNMSANATITSVSYQAQTDTDGSGNYSLNVPNGSWSVSVSCNGGDDSLDGILGNGNYACPNNQTVNISNGNAVTNFTVQLCSGVQITTASPLPGAVQGQSYYQQLQASSCFNTFTWVLNNPANFPSAQGLNFVTNGIIFGTPTGSGTFVFSVNVDDGNGHTANTNLSLTIAPALQITTTNLPNGTNGFFYSKTLSATGGQGSYSWSLSPGSLNLPANLSLSSGGLLSGTAATNGVFSFSVRVTDSLSSTADQALSLNLGTTNLPPLSVGSAGGQIIVLWPAAAGTNFIVQTTTNLATGPWVTATNGVPQISLIFSNTSPARFFRLVPP